MRKFYEKTCKYCGKSFVASDPRTKYCSKDCVYNSRRMLKDLNVQNLRIHNIYDGMKYRCINPNHKDYKNYGARGISVCQEWLDSFLNFYNWSMQNGYQDDLTIDRIDNSGNYCPENCRWVSSTVQNNNRDVNKIIEYNGEKHTISEWTKITGLPYTLIWSRHQKGWKAEDIFEKPSRNKNKTNSKKIEFAGKCLSRSAWDKLKGFPTGTIALRLSRGWTIEKAITTPIDTRFSYKGVNDE